MKTGHGPAPRGQTRVPKVFYGWYIVAAGTISSFASMAVFRVGLSIFIKDVREELGWSLTAISLGFSLKQLETGILAPVSGYLIDHVGPRKMAIAGTIVMTVGLLLFARMHSIGTFYAASLIIAIGQGMGANLAFITPVMHWFRRKRGRASAFLASGRGWGYIGALPIAFLLGLYGWRQTTNIVAIIFFVISLPMALVLRLRPEPYGYRPDGDMAPALTESGTTHEPQAGDDGSFTVKEAFQSPAFWLVLLSNSLYGFSTSTNHVHFITHMRYTGFSASEAALIVTIYGGVQVVSRLTFGWVGDRMGRHRLLIISFLLMGVGWPAIAFISPNALWAVVLYYLTYASGQAAHTVTAQTIVADFFGPRRYATIRGIMNPIGVLGGVTGPLFAGVMFDRFGNYELAFFTLGLLVALGAPVMYLAGKPTLSGDPTLATERKSSPGS